VGDDLKEVSARTTDRVEDGQLGRLGEVVGGVACSSANDLTSCRPMPRALIGFLIAFTSLSGCISASIRLAPAPPSDLTVPRHVERRFSAIMVLPPHGSEHGQASELSDVERVLLGGGIRVISSGVTGRVVLDSSGNPGNRVETAANLSDLERALVLAKNSNADALLQIIEIGWTDGHRAFVLTGDQFQEVATGAEVEGQNLVRVQEAIFRVQARVISVENGEILMSIDVSQGTSSAIPEPKAIVVQSSPTQGVATQTIDTDDPDRRRRAVSQVMDTLLARLR
jgi:hypothetical protein